MDSAVAQPIAIHVDGVYKDFQLPSARASSIKSLLTGFYRKNTDVRSDEVQRALQNVSLDIKQGEFFGIVGRNGSGKSTLLKILAGIYQPTKGSVSVNGKLVPFIELGVGFNPELTGRENVYLNGAILGFSQHEINHMYDDIVDFAELEKFMDQKLKNYSSGMQVRLAFSMAARAKADILLVDEVLAVGDADFQRKCFEYFGQLKRSKTTVVFVSHDMEAIREYCDRALLIEDSKVKAIGKTSDIAELYLKLFNNNENDKDAEADVSGRWGNGSVVTKEISVAVSNYIVIQQTIEAVRATNRPIVGFRLRSSADSAVAGTNSKIERIDIGSLKKGEQRVVEWRFPNVLSDGKYIVDPAILGPDGVSVADWWDDATSFTVKKDRHVGYILDPEFNVSVRGGE